jgi:hypothetical protein
MPGMAETRVSDAANSGQTAKMPNQLTRQIDGALPLHANAQEDRQQFGI